MILIIPCTFLHSRISVSILISMTIKSKSSIFQGLPNSSPEQMAENSLMMGRLVEAETLLLHNKKYKEAMNLCIRMHNWDRALDIARKNNVEMDLILGERKKYLMALGREETNEKFLELNK